ISPGAKMGCFSFIKVVMILFNLAIFLGGGTFLGVGIWVTVDEDSFLNIFGTLSPHVMHVANVGYLIIVIGAILLVIGFLGCYGAQKESKCLLITFFSVVLVIFIAEIAAAVMALVYTGLAEMLLSGVLTPLLKEKYGVDERFTENWNLTMEEVHCCGVSNYTDFNDTQWVIKHETYPAPCLVGGLLPLAHPHLCGCLLQGCFDKIVEEIRTHAGVLGGVAAGIAALEIVPMVLAMYLYCHLDQK
ncbi:TSN1 protein, partial [Bucco capensis]|nr:TSN1 protein [Bucco capensis]